MSGWGRSDGLLDCCVAAHQQRIEQIGREPADPRAKSW
jgi:hypothetical protein